jgi:hypothetical protein
VDVDRISTRKRPAGGIVHVILNLR